MYVLETFSYKIKVLSILYHQMKEFFLHFNYNHSSQLRHSVKQTQFFDVLLDCCSRRLRLLEEDMYLIIL
jgi:hypothetical protein